MCPSSFQTGHKDLGKETSEHTSFRFLKEE